MPARCPYARESVIPIQIAQQWLVGVEPWRGFEENRAINAMDTPCTGMDGSVVWSADRGGVVFVGVATFEPFFDVVDIRQYGRGGTPWYLASAVAGKNGTPLGGREKSVGALLI